MGNTQSHRSTAMMESCWVDIGKADQIPHPDSDLTAILPLEGMLLSVSLHPSQSSTLSVFLCGYIWPCINWDSSLPKNCNIFSSFLGLQVWRPLVVSWLQQDSSVFWKYSFNLSAVMQSSFIVIIINVISRPDLFSQSTLSLSEKT